MENYPLIAILASTSCLFGLGMLMLGRLQGLFRGFHWLGAGYLLLGVGAALIPMRGHIPDALSIILSNVLIVTALACQLEALTQFAFIPNRHRRLSVILVLCAVGFVQYFSVIAPNLQWRIVLLSLVFAAFTGLCARAALTPVEGRRLPSQFAAAGFCLLATGVSLARATLTLIYHPGRNYLITDWVQTAASAGYLVFLIGFAFSLIWLAVQRIGMSPPDRTRD